MLCSSKITPDYGSTTTTDTSQSPARPPSPIPTNKSSEKYDQAGVSHRSLLLDKLAWLRRDSANSLQELTSRFGSFLVGSVLWSAVLLCTLVIPFVMLIVGSALFGECPREPRVPLFLVVSGSASTLNNGLNVADRFRRIGDASPARGFTAIGIVTSLLNCFSVAWLILGCVWVYGAYKPSWSPNSGSLYCHPGVYLLAFWVLNGFFLFLLAIIIVAAVAYGWSLYFSGPSTLPV